MRIFDTTLRDGEQSPGATLTSKEKLDIARQLARLGVDIIEAGFPVASPDDFEAVRSIALDVGNAVDEDGYVPVICGLARTTTRRGAGPRWPGWRLRGGGPPELGPAGAPWRGFAEYDWDRWPTGWKPGQGVWGLVCVHLEQPGLVARHAKKPSSRK